ncbi:MAG: hypothetical protein COS89_09000 [Deltaproteobacteria bacterium CG07_land_8_20_14_0_80_38_7]|nr:MAG: hypothetical protein COS89_09000 [Deltaproteobacteria bacterium CG07_land_8_20_14_0_80_38_7]
MNRKTIKLLQKCNCIFWDNYHLLKSLTYFGDAEKQPMPKMLIEVSWNEVKKGITSFVKNAHIL